eukprot:1044004_1
MLILTMSLDPTSHSMSLSLTYCMTSDGWSRGWSSFGRDPIQNAGHDPIQNTGHDPMRNMNYGGMCGVSVFITLEIALSDLSDRCGGRCIIRITTSTQCVAQLLRSHHIQ